MYVIVYVLKEVKRFEYFKAQKFGKKRKQNGKRQHGFLAVIRYFK